MNAKILVVALIATVIVVGCNHNSSSNVRIRKMTSSRGSSTEYFYGADNKVSYSLADGVKTTFKFSQGKVEQTMNDSARGRVVNATFFLNAKGLADSVVTVQGPLSYVSTFKHDENGYITEVNQFRAGSLLTVSKNDLKDGNTVSNLIYDSAQTKLGAYYFDFYPDKTNSLTYAAQGLDFLGNDSKNLRKKMVQVRATGDTLGAVDFTYHYDDKGRVASQVVFQGPQLLDSTTYTYY